MERLELYPCNNNYIATNSSGVRCTRNHIIVGNDVWIHDDWITAINVRPITDTNSEQHVVEELVRNCLPPFCLCFKCLPRNVRTYPRRCEWYGPLMRSSVFSMFFSPVLCVFNNRVFIILFFSIVRLPRCGKMCTRAQHEKQTRSNTRSLIGPI